MRKRRNIFFFGGILLLIQLFSFYDYIFPFHWNQIKVSGLACTCPDENVINGMLYLKSITPDSLEKYDLNYWEIYVTERPSTKNDPQGVDLYILKGEIIGKDRVTEDGPWHPVFKIKNWREVSVLKNLLIKLLFFGQVLIWLVMMAAAENKTVHNSGLPPASQ